MDWRQHLRLLNYPLSPEAADLITRLCCDAEDRLGNCRSEYTPTDESLSRSVNPRLTTDLGAEEIKNHPFFRQIDWSKNLRKQPSPYVPTIRHHRDTSNFDDFDEDASPLDMWSDSPAMTPRGLTDKAAKDHSFFHFTYRRFFDTNGDEDEAVMRTPVHNSTGGGNFFQCGGSGGDRGECNEQDSWVASKNLVKSPEFREPPSYHAAVSPSSVAMGVAPQGAIGGQNGKPVGSPRGVLKNSKSRDDKPVYV